MQTTNANQSFSSGEMVWVLLAELSVRDFLSHQLSARADHRVLKLARTISDVAGSEEIQPVHLGEALQYRPKLMLN